MAFFLFPKSIIIFDYSLKELQNFFVQPFPQKKYVCFLCDQFVVIEYPQGICSPIFVVEEFAGLFSVPSVFLIKDSILA